jgi:hypothetical protein
MVSFPIPPETPVIITFFMASVFFFKATLFFFDFQQFIPFA